MRNVRQMEREVRRRQFLNRPPGRAFQCLKHQTQRLLLSQAKLVYNATNVIDVCTDSGENKFPFYDGTQFSPAIRVRIHKR